jgi:SanA protein
VKRTLIIVCTATIVAIVALTIGSSAIINTETDNLTYSDISAVPHYQVGLLLGCPRKLSGGRINVYFTSRIAAAVNLYKTGRIEYLLVSGDNVSRGCNETISMKTELIKQGIPSDRIYCDFRGMRTLDSVVRARDIFGQNKILIISQEFHNRRAIFLASHRGIDAIGFNAEDVAFSESVGTHLRDILSRLRAMLDIYVFGSGPHYSGEKISIGTQNASQIKCAGQ